MDLYNLSKYRSRIFYLPVKPASSPSSPPSRPPSPLPIDSEPLSSSSSFSSSSSDLSSNETVAAAIATGNLSKDEQLALEKHADDFYWTYQEEPHRTRRMRIMRAHPEVTKLCGIEPLTKYIISCVVALQFATAYYLRDSSLSSVKFWLLAYVIGATANQNVFLCIHELSHNLGFKKPLHNRLFAIFANLPIGIPYSASFRPYHLIHHKHLGDADLDADLPTKLEAVVLSNLAGKAFFATFQILFYALRPMFVMTLPFSSIHLLNIVVQLLADFVLVRSFGWMPLLYFIMSDFLAGSWHPLAGHFIAEHYILNPKEISSGMTPPDTYSYYGILNLFTYNVGLHNEHHDFPYIPWTRLPLLTQIAHEFYEPLPFHESWSRVIWDFVFDKDVSLWCRVKRGSTSSFSKGKIVSRPLVELNKAKIIHDDDVGDDGDTTIALKKE
ncbi:fatty acid desaturase-domain-containing protein [Kockiozyma suomiensis]|uniref:fatty acid desaturase-domain-containing protein n=1 Tax=Kockiozyma suomiensis TaxID=1337062 RepID=UPI0033438740